MSTDGATQVPENEGDPCITYDAENKPHTGKHKFEWASSPNGDTTHKYFEGKRCKNCGEVRPA